MVKQLAFLVIFDPAVERIYLIASFSDPREVRLELQLGFYVFHFRFVPSPFCFLLTEFHCNFLCIKYYHIMFINIVPPGGSGWIIGVDQLGNSSTVSGRNDPGENRPELQFRILGLHFFVPALLLSMLTHLFLSFSLSLFYFILAVPMRKYLRKHSCRSSSFPMVILNDTSFFRLCNYKCTLCIRSKKLEIVVHQ